MPGPNEYRVRASDGSYRWVQTSSRPVVVDGRLVALTGVLTDITDRRRAEDALRESEGMYRALVEQSITGVALVQDELFAYVNPRLAAMVGLEPEEMTGLPVLDLVVEEDRQAVAESRRRRLSGEAASDRLSFRARHASGATVELELFGVAISYRGRAATLGTLLDVTELRRAEAERLELERRLLHAQKLESLGLLAGGIAHDFNNLLMAVLGNLDFARDELPAGAEALASIDQAIAASRRAADPLRRSTM